MNEKTYEKNLDALNTGIAKSREEIAVLAAGLKKLAEFKIDKSRVDPPEGPTNGNKLNGGWTRFQYSLDEVGARGKKVAKRVADEIERHPLIGGTAAFGFGFVIAMALFRRSKRDFVQ